MMDEKIFEKVNKFHISVDGNISSGKTTLGQNLLNLFQTFFPRYFFEFLPEDGHEHGTLGIWSENKAELSGMFQMWMFSHTLARTLRAKDLLTFSPLDQPAWVMVDRSLRGNAAFEAISHFTEKNISENEHSFYALARKSTSMMCDLNVYLFVHPSECFRRMLGRDTKEEVEGYTPQYLWDIEMAHFIATLANLSQPEAKIRPQLILDWGKDHGKIESFCTIIDPVATDLVAKKPLTQVVLMKQSSPQRSEPALVANVTKIILLKDDSPLYCKKTMLKVMNYLSHKSHYDGFKKLLLIVPDDTPDSFFNHSFQLQIY